MESPVHLKLIDVSTEDLITELLSRADNGIIYLSKRVGKNTIFKNRFIGDHFHCVGQCNDMKKLIEYDYENGNRDSLSEDEAF